MENIKIYNITGMSCASCALNIEKALNKQDYVSNASVNFANKKAYITLNKSIKDNEIIKIVKDAGYNAESIPQDNPDLKELRLSVNGMSCTSCALNVEKTILNIEGIKEAKVNYTDKSAVIKLDKTVKLSLIKEKVKEIGFELVEPEEKQSAEEKYLKKEKLRLIIAWIITIPLTIKMLGEMIFGFYIFSPQIAFYIDLILAFPVIFIVGFPVIKAAFFSVIRFSFNMDSLIGIGTIAAYSTGIIHLFGIDIANFAVVGAMIMGINFIGNYLKQLATGRASQAIKQLLQLGAKSAHLIQDDGTEKDVNVEDLVIGDIVLVKPGEKIPVDGVIIEGETSIDESIATGESIPVDKSINDKVIGATINKQGAVKVRIEKIGKDTFLSRIITMVEEAQGSKVPIQAFADKVTSYFVPIVLVISILTFLFWLFFPQFGKNILSIFNNFIPWINLDLTRVSMALFASIATLVIACPCALGLATPTALMVGMGKGAVNGILIRNGEAIQTSKQVNTVVFDKTGTITQGKPSVLDFKTSLNSNDFWSIVSNIEKLSEHPLAQAIVNRAEKENIIPKQVNKFKAITGKGINAFINNKEIDIGSLKYFNELKIEYNEFDKELKSFQESGYTVILAAENKKTIGLIGISDDIKDDSISAIKELHNLGIKTVILTGDNKTSAEAVAKKTGIDEVYPELLPGDKINIIKNLQSEGRIVAMVGDGINDAPALKQADVGIAIGTGTDIAIESADITLVSGSILGVVKSIKLSRATFKKIRQNLFWAFFYNIIAIPLAVSGILHPAVAEAAMALSSINVVGNSLRLRNIKID